MPGTGAHGSRRPAGRKWENATTTPSQTKAPRCFQFFDNDNVAKDLVKKANNAMVRMDNDESSDNDEEISDSD